MLSADVTLEKSLTKAGCCDGVPSVRRARTIVLASAKELDGTGWDVDRAGWDENVSKSWSFGVRCRGGDLASDRYEAS